VSNLLNAIILGVVEGITEFLRISSTGHLIVASDLLRFKDAGGTFEIVIQLGAVLAVVWFYRTDLIERVCKTAASRQTRRFWLNLFVAFLPAAITGLAFEKFITEQLFSPLTVAASLIIGGIILWLVERRREITESVPTSGHTIQLDRVTTRQALLIGFTQITALVPGVSRSGSSIVGGLLSGLDRETATAFSFYLAIPTLGGATLYKLLKNLHQIASQGAALNLAIGTTVAFITAWLAIGWLLRYVAHHDFRSFAVYRILAGLLIIAWVSLR
jgi:undecaprenyl-diphosphatase